MSKSAASKKAPKSAVVKQMEKEGTDTYGDLNLLRPQS